MTMNQNYHNIPANASKKTFLGAQSVISAKIDVRTYPYIFTKHIHKSVELYLVDSGSCSMEIGSRKFTFYPGDLVIIYPNIVHSFYLEAGTDTEVVLSLPIDGNIAISREFGKMIRTYSDENRSEDTSRRGIDINASVGTLVKAAAEGKVEEVSSNTTDGTYVVIAHANGLKTKYTNLSEEVKVAVEDVVNAGTEIGTVGNTSGIFTSKVCGDVLNVQVQDANGNDVNPSSYFNFK